MYFGIFNAPMENLNTTIHNEYDFVIVGTGFGGSVAAYRLAQKGYSVLMLEKGKRFGAQDFPKTNMNLRKWLWLPMFRFFGFFKITFFKHVGILSGVGVGGGSLVYANTLPVPADAFFQQGSWADCADWKRELEPHYAMAKKMLGAQKVPFKGPADEALQLVAEKIGKAELYSPTEVGVYFGEPGEEAEDPYFDGKGPARKGCIYCGACMTGCRHNAKNSLDKNYLYLAEKLDARIKPETEVLDISSLDEKGENGYTLTYRSSTSAFAPKKKMKAKRLILSGGVLGSVKLLLQSQKKGLKNLSPMLGQDIRTNNESLIGIVNRDHPNDFSKGVAIGSILHTDQHSHLEVCRYGKGSSFWRFGFVPLATGRTFFKRMGSMFTRFFSKPLRILRIAFRWNFTTQNSILLFMQTLNSTIRFVPSGNGMKSELNNDVRPSSFIPEAQKLAETYSETVNGEPFIVPTEALFGIPTTAHILGGCVIGSSPEKGVIDAQHRAFNYKNLWVMDGSAISSNPGVNPSLTITAMTERAISFIPPKGLT
jgi:cholesterol oxidase